MARQLFFAALLLAFTVLSTAQEPMLSTSSGSIILTPAGNGSLSIDSAFSFRTNNGGEVVTSEEVLAGQAGNKKDIGALTQDIAAVEESLKKDLAQAEESLQRGVLAVSENLSQARNQLDLAVAAVQKKFEEEIIRLQSQVDLLQRLGKPCPPGKFSTKEPTLASERVCKSHRGPCANDQVEAKAPTPTSDRACEDTKPCPSNTWQVFAATPFSSQRCVEVTECSPGEEYQTKAPTTTSDRKCSHMTLCSLGVTYQIQSPSPTRNRICKGVRSPCSSDEDETKPSLTRDRACGPKVSTYGCKPGTQHARKINKYLYVCSSGATTLKSYDATGQQCNNAGKWYLAGTKVHTVLKRPTSGEWSSASTYLRATNHDYVITGQPTRSCYWGSWTSGFNCNGLGYISTGESVYGSNWNSLLDGDGRDRRNWPSANAVSVSYHRLAALCVSASHIPNAYVFGKYIWRLGNK